MIAKTVFTLLLSGTLFSCSGQQTSTAEATSPLSISIERFDKALYSLLEKGDSLLQNQFKRDYPQMLDITGKGILNVQTPDDPHYFSKLATYYAEPTLRRLYQEAIAQYDDVSDIEKGLGGGFTYLRGHFPNLQIPAIYMHVSGLNQNVLVGDSLLSLSIDKYMGVDYPLYQDFFYDYQRQKMQRHNVVPDYLAGWLMAEFPFTGKENVLLERMVYEGKIRHLIHEALPDLSPTDLMGYTAQNLAWCQAREGDIWKAIIERKDLYTPDQLNTSKYFEEASTHHLATDAPGNIGVWMGWQIVKRYMAETGSSIRELMDCTDAQKILEAARYKPE